MRAFVVTLLLGALVASGCGGEENEAASSMETSTVPTATSEAGSDRPLAPPIEGTSLEGEPISLANFAGRPVLVNVWSSW